MIWDDKPIVLQEASAAYFRIMDEAWPVYAALHGLKNPWRREDEQYKMVHEKYTVKVDDSGKKHVIEAMRMVKNPEAPPPPTWQEKCDYRFEEDKFAIKHLVDEGYYDYANKLVNDNIDAFGNKKRLQEYFDTLLPCRKNGQCTMFCPHFYGEDNDGCCH